MMSHSASSSTTATATVRQPGSTGSSGSSSTTTAAGLQRFPYHLKNVLDFPRRIFHPPYPSVPRVGSVRSFKLTPCYRVTLQDVLKGRHLPPLGRKEFENFLYFKEYSVENLYFCTWLEQYQAQWNHWVTKRQSNTSDDDGVARPVDIPNTKPSSQLAMSYARAKETFFTHGSPWELNLPQKTIQQLLQPQQPHPGPKAHPHPCAFAEVRFEVENYLADSLTRFIAQNGGNAGRHRGLFAVAIGVIIIAIGLLPIILFSLGSHSHSWGTRLYRLGSIPVLWLGFAALIAGLHGVCIIIFLFGDARQLHPYELRLPEISSPIHCAPDLSFNPNLAANEHERKRLSVRRPTLPSLVTHDLDATGNVSSRRRRSLTVTVSVQQEKEIKTEYIHLPNRIRTGTVTSPTSATGRPSESKSDTKPPDLDDPALIRAENQLNFDLYDEEDDMKAGEDMNRDDGYSSSELHGIVEVQNQTPTSYSTTLYPDTPVGFDFDSLPLPPGMRAPDWKLSRSGSNSTSLDRCQRDAAVPSTWHNMEAVSSSVNVTASSSTSHIRRKINQIKGWEWNKERTVFSPLTKVLDPVITRTQWEIVMRSALVALVISIVIPCASLGIP